MHLALRRARDDDWPAAWAIQRAAFEDLVIRTYGGWSEEQVAKCRDTWDFETTSMIETSAGCIGWVRVEHHDDHDWLDLIVVRPESQRASVGGEVVQRLLAAAEARGVPLWLSVHRRNRARRLYARLGMREFSRDPLRVFMCSPEGGSAGPPRR